MRILLDTPVLIWWFSDLMRLSPAVQTVITDDQNQIFVGTLSAWEMAINAKAGKPPNVAPLMADLEGAILDGGGAPRPVTMGDGERAGSLPLHHKDPFDRMLIARALAGSLVLISNERIFDRYGVARLW